jgi:serine/threonine protein kinase
LDRIPNDKCRKFIESLPATTNRTLAEAVQGAIKEALDFLNKTLLYDPDERIDVGQALAHVYLSQLHCPEDEPVRTPLEMSDFEFERRKIDIVALREEIFIEALRYHPDKREVYFEEQALTGKSYSISNYRFLDPGESQYTSDEEAGE